MRHFKTQQSGFTLVETFVSITILLIVIIGPMTISSSTAKSTSFSSEQVVAFFLAQEGAEMVQKARDDLILRNFLPLADGNYLATPWQDFINPTGVYQRCFQPTGCGLELNTDTVGSLKTPVTCSGSNCDLYFNSGSDRSRYTHVGAGATTTPYTRIIKFTEVANRELKVTSRVSWRTGSQRQSQEVVVETYLFNIYDN